MQIAICMATHNPDASLFAAQVDSIKEQEHDEWICIVGDDCSEAERRDQIRATIGDDERFRLHEFEQRLGFYRNFERLLGLVPAEADLVAFCDQDDRWHPEKLRVLEAALGPRACLAYSDMRVVDERGGVISTTYWTRRRNNSTDLVSLLIANTVTGTASLFRRDLLEWALPFPVAGAGSFHDRWLALVALAVGELAYVEAPLLDYVQHDGAAIGHGAANRGGASRRGLAGWRSTICRLRSGELARRWRDAYFDVYRRTAIEAATLAERCGPEMTPAKRRAAHRLAVAENWPLAVPWLQLRSLRRHFGRDETLGVERGLARGIAWRQLTAVRARALGAGD